MRHAPREREARERAEAVMLQDEIGRMTGRQENLQNQIDEIWDELQNFRETESRRSREAIDALDRQIADLERQVSRLESARAEDRKEIIDRMTATISQMLASSAAAQPASRGSQTGVEHTVRPGETLSEIASAYGVTVRALIQANSMQNPDRIRAGDRIFIPD